MNTEAVLTSRRVPGLETDADFARWVREIVRGAAELQAFDAGQIDAIMDPATRSAILSPAARSALQASNRLYLALLDALPGEVCVIDSVGTVVATNRAWRAFVDSSRGAGLAVREGGNFFAACCDPVSSHRTGAPAVARGLRQVLVGARREFRGEYGCLASDGHCTFTLVIAHFAANGVAHALVTREHVGKHKDAVALGASKRASLNRVASMPRTGTSNRLLAALPEDEYQRLLARLEPVQLTYGQVLYEPGKQIRHVYFPNNCPVSLLTVVEGDRSLEVGLVGCEGMIGFPVALGSSTSSVRGLVQGTGTGLRMEPVEFLKEYQRSPALQQVLLCFSEGLMNQVTQNAACNHFHAIQQRLARWLLMMRERVPSRSFHLTHEYLADMLGTRRETVTQGAYALGCRNLIRYSRGNITILDRRGLEAVSCSCYRRVKIVGPKASA